MEEGLLNQCISITKEIKSHPLSVLFREEYKADKKAMKDYLSVIKYPMDLTTILENLEKRNYQNFESWADDMDLIFENAITYNLEDSFIGGIAIYLRKKVQKKIFQLRLRNPKIFETLLSKILGKIKKIIENPPQNLSNHTIEFPEVPEIDKSKIDNLVELLNKLVNQGKTDKILEIMNANGLSVDTESKDAINIDVNDLNFKTINKLMTL